jgi:hypothetical protein
MQLQPLSSSECFFIRWETPALLYISSISPYNGFHFCVLFFVSPSFLRKQIRMDIEEKISTDKNYIIFPLVEVLIFFSSSES